MVTSWQQTIIAFFIVTGIQFTRTNQNIKNDFILNLEEITVSFN